MKQMQRLTAKHYVELGKHSRIEEERIDETRGVKQPQEHHTHNQLSRVHKGSQRLKTEVIITEPALVCASSLHIYYSCIA